MESFFFSGIAICFHLISAPVLGDYAARSEYRVLIVSEIFNMVPEGTGCNMVFFTYRDFY